jgi:hypothetical protein
MEAPCIVNLGKGHPHKHYFNERFFNLVRLLMQNTDYEVFAIQHGFTSVGPCELLTWFVDMYVDCTNASQTYAKQRYIEFCIYVLISQPNLASLVYKSFSQKSVRSAIESHARIALNTHFMLQCAAVSLARHYAFLLLSTGAIFGMKLASENNYKSHVWCEAERSELLSLINFLAKTGMCLHQLSSMYYNTPLQTLFMEVIKFIHDAHPYEDVICLLWTDAERAAFPEHFAQAFTLLARVWLEQLHKAGIDLVQYGLGEKLMLAKVSKIFNEKPVEYRLFMVTERGPMTRDFEWDLRLSTFEYGPSPEDWKFWVLEEADDSFNEFWDMADHPERTMPGAWSDWED